jgi:hypothetical protein
MRMPAHVLSALTTSCWLIACTTPDSHADPDADTTTTETSTETMGETSNGDGDETGSPEGAECQADLQDCPDGYKCLLRLGAEDWEFVCLPVLGNADAGEVCEHDGVIAGTDDCNQDTWCIGPFDPSGMPWSGLCYPLCAEQGCASEERCVGIGSLPVCAPICDPLASGACGNTDEACIYRPPEGFVCFPQGAEGNGLGEPCPTGASCAAGLHCSQFVAGCDPAEYCCTDYCDTNAPDNICAAQDLGAQCEVIGATDPNQAHVGACVIAD